MKKGFYHNFIYGIIISICCIPIVFLVSELSSLKSAIKVQICVKYDGVCYPLPPEERREGSN